MTPLPAALTSGYLTTRQAADRIGVTPNYVRELIRAGALNAIDIGSGTRPTFRVAGESVESFRRERAVSITPTQEVA